MIIGTITITSLDPIGNAVSGSTLIPVVNMAGVPVTQKMDVANLSSYILSQGNVANFTIQNLTIESSANLGNVANLKILGGTNGYVLQTDGTGNLSWTAQTGGNSSNAVPGGANTQVQFNDAGSFNGNSGFTFDKTHGALAIPLIDTQAVYNLAGLVVENADLEHDATSALLIPSNGDNVTPVQLNNFYGNVVITSAVDPGNTVAWTFGSDSTLSTPGNVYVGNYNAGVIVWSPNTVGLTTDHVNDNTGIYLVKDGDIEIYANGNISIYANDVSNVHQWTFDNTGNLIIPGNVQILNTSFIDFNGGDTNWRMGYNLNAYTKTTATTTIDIEVGQGSVGPDGFTVGQTGGQSILELNGYTRDAYLSNNLTVAGNLSIDGGTIFGGTPTQVETNTTILAIETANPAVVIFNDAPFVYPIRGTAVISGVTTTTQANGTWYFEAYDPDAIMLFTDSTYATPVDASGWTLYQTSQAGQDLNGAGNNYVLIDPVAYPDLIANVQVGWTASDGSANYAVTTITPDYQSGYTLYLMSGGNFASNSTVTFFSPVNGNISITIETPSPTVTINAGGFETVFTNYGNVVLPSIAEANVSSLASPFNNDLVLYAGSSNLFTFGANSQLTLPGGIHMPGTIQWNGGSQVYEDSDIIISSPQGVGLTSPNTTTINAGSFNWNFDNTGNLTLPGGINSTNGIPINSTQSINALVNGVTGVEITTGTVGIYADNILSLQLDGSNSDFRNQNIINASTLQVNNSANVLSLTTRNGDSNPVYSAAQITMGYAGTTDYAQWIHTRHNGGSSQYNTIEFYTNDGTQNAVFPANAILGLTVNGGNVGVGNVLNPGNVLDVSGNVWANGSITATSFIGNGSQLTNLPPTALSTRATAVGPGGNLYITPTDGFVLVNRNGQTTVNIIIDNTTPIGHQFIIKESSGFSTALTVQSDDTANVLTDGQTSVSIGSNVRNSVTVVVASADGGSGKGLWIIGQFHD